MFIPIPTRESDDNLSNLTTSDLLKLFTDTISANLNIIVTFYEVLDELNVPKGTFITGTLELNDKLYFTVCSNDTKLLSKVLSRMKGSCSRPIVAIPLDDIVSLLLKEGKECELRINKIC